MDGASTPGLSDLPRNYKGKGWQLDKVRRWRSKPWRDFVRGLPPWLPEGHDPVVAAHFRYPGCGTAIRPADCFVYPIFDSHHKDMHNKGQESYWTQWEWVTTTMVKGLAQGALVASVLADSWIRGLKVAALDRTFSLSTPNIEAVAAEWARLFLDGSLKLEQERR